ncbi:hypothetical protein DWU98_10825 [Dyella monticola]|uniref:Uncharacterized protein n=1 Tax=Dyella monticola TaxID=1927958 RepID=A0A370WZW2_9GAMM|nr:hypothetical protein [Dyella monticola]RDS81704.1 hypothetical protein DWU98_10825 [Dyella monticola]
MIIRPPFLPQDDHIASSTSEDDLLMAIVERHVQRHGIFPVTYDPRAHSGTHLTASSQTEAVRAITDGEVVEGRTGEESAKHR